MSVVAHLPFYMRCNLILLSVVALSACDAQYAAPDIPAPVKPTAEMNDIKPAKNLTEVAGRATLPEQTKMENMPIKIYEKPFVGRYRASIPCDDGFVPCTEGKAEYIINLLEDGSVHRSIVQYGKVFTEKTNPRFSNTNYRRDRWSVDPKQKELIVHRKEGVNFYYKIKDRQHIQMNLEKIYNGNEGKNKDVFDRGYPKPSKAYELVRQEVALS